MPIQDSPTLNPQATELAELTRVIADLSDAPADAVLWRDLFCSECGDNECVNGTAAQLAQKVESLGWGREDRHSSNVTCPKCVVQIPATNPAWERAEYNLAQLKESRNA